MTDYKAMRDYKTVRVRLMGRGDYIDPWPVKTIDTTANVTIDLPDVGDPLARAAAVYARALMTAIAKTEAEDLTGSERLALAINAGCAIKTSTNAEGYVVMGTLHPVGFAHIDGQWRVYEGR